MELQENELSELYFYIGCFGREGYIVLPPALVAFVS